MQICVVYLDGDDTGPLQDWVTAYESSGTSLEACLLTDERTPIPDVWPYDVVREEVASTPAGTGAAARRGWLAAQAYDLVGRCLVMNPRAMIEGNLDRLAEIDCDFAMVRHPRPYRCEEWPEIQEVLGSYVLLLNSLTLSGRVRNHCAAHPELHERADFFDLVFSAICREIGIGLEDAGRWRFSLGELAAVERVPPLAEPSPTESDEPSAEASVESSAGAGYQSVRVHFTGRDEQGIVFDTTRNGAPLEFTLGEGRIMPGFEELVRGMSPGESVTATVPAEKAYGLRREEMLAEVSRSELPRDIDLKVGEMLRIPRIGDEPVEVRIADVGPESVLLDGNHPLAGQALTFEVELLACG